MRLRTNELACAVLLLGAAVAAAADMADVVLVVNAVARGAQGVVEIAREQGSRDGGDFFWSSETAIPIMSGSKTLGTFGPGYLAVHADGAIAFGFAFCSADEEMTFTMSSGYLSFPTIPWALLRASAAFTVEDLSGKGAALDVLARAYVDGDRTFGELGQSIVVTPPETLAAGGSACPEGGGFLPYPDVSGTGGGPHHGSHSGQRVPGIRGSA